MLYLRSGQTQQSLLKHDWKDGPPGHKDLHHTFMLMEITWPQYSLLDILECTAGLLFLLFEVQKLNLTCRAACNLYFTEINVSVSTVRSLFH